MKTRRSLTLGITAVLVGGLIVALALREPDEANAADTNCTLTIPNRIDIAAPSGRVTVKKTCVGEDPLEVAWVGWRGTTKVQDIWFLDENERFITIYDSDPLGLRTWKGEIPVDPALKKTPADIVFNQPATDIRLSSGSIMSAFSQATAKSR